jgi:hypothetical protein
VSLSRKCCVDSEAVLDTVIAVGPAWSIECIAILSGLPLVAASISMVHLLGSRHGPFWTWSLLPDFTLLRRDAHF